MLPTTKAIVESSGSISAQTITIAADADNRVQTFAKVAGGGATDNGDADKSPDARTTKPGKAEGNARTADGDISVAAALGFTWLNASSEAYAKPTSGTLTLTGAAALDSLKVHVGARNRSTTQADAGSVGDTSGGSGGVAVAVAVNLADINNHAYLGGNLALHAAKTIVEALTPSGDEFKALSTSGVGDSSSSDLGVAGSLAVNLVFTPTTAVLKSGSTDANGADLSFTATTTTTSEAKADANATTGDSTGVGASVTLHVVDNQTTAAIENSATLTEAHDVTLSATATDTMTTTVKTGASGGNAVAAGAAISFSNVTTKATIGTGTLLEITGSLSVTAMQTASVTTSAEGAASGSSVGVGAALALAFVNHTVEASTARSLDVDGSITLHAIGSSKTETKSKASAAGEEDDSTAGDNKKANSQGDNQLTKGKDQAADNGNASTSKTETKKAGTAEGDSVEVAAAITFNDHESSVVASIANDLDITAGGAVMVKAESDTDAKATADGSAKDASSAGIAAAVAVNFVNITDKASIGLGVELIANGLTVSAGMRSSGGSDGKHTIYAEAKSGASASGDIGIAGALAINIISGHTEAIIRGNPAHAPPTDVNAGSGDVSITATSNEADTAKATSEADAGGDGAGVGASVALNIFDPSITRAEVEEGARFSAADDVTITASSTRTVETTVVAGSEGGTAVTPAVALLVNIDDQVTARLAPVSTGTLAAGGNITITATHTATYTTKAEAEAAGDNAVGADLAMNAVLGWSTTAAIDRSVSGDAVSITADSTMTSTAEAKASAEGSSGSDDSADDKSDKQVNNNTNTAGKTGGGVPSSNDSASTGNSNASTQSGSSGGSVGIAAAISVNWVVTDNVARVGNNAHVTGTTGAVSVSAKNQNDSSAKAYGLSSNLNNSNNIAAAVGLNVVDVSNTASVGDDAHVEGVGITVEAITPAGQQNDFIVWGLAGAGGKSDFSVSASVGIQVINYETTAKVQQGADLESTGGITVHATAFLGLQSLALAGGVSIGGTAVGASLVVNLLQDFTTSAFIDSGTGVGSITHADATGAIQVKAEAHLHPLVPDPAVTKITFPALMSVAVAGGAGTGNLSVSGSIVIDVWDLTTKAYIADGAQVNQTTAGGTGQTVEVSSIDDTDVVNVAGALSLSSSGAGVGIGLIVSVVNKDVRAYIGKSADVNSGGDVTIHATSTEDWDMIAVNGAASANSAAVTGSIIVVVVNAGSGPPGVSAYVDGAAGEGSSVHSAQDVDVQASNTVDMLLLAGGLAFGSSAGIGVSAAVLVRTDRAKAWIGRDADIEAKGSDGLGVKAVQSTDLFLLAAGGAGGGDAGIAGSAVVDVLESQTHAYIDRGATINGVNTGAAATQGIKISASDTTEILAIAGTVSVGGTASVGAGVDVEAITKGTRAWIGPDVTANVRGDITVDADSSESITSIAVGGGFGGTAAVNVNAAVSVLGITTQAFVEHGLNSSDGAVLTADGNVRIAADETLDLDLVAGNISGSGTAAVGAAASVPVITKTTTPRSATMRASRARAAAAA